MKISIHQLNLLSLGDFKKTICYLIFTALCLAPLFGGEYFIPLYVIVYLDFLKNSRNYPKDTLSKQCLVGFLISIIATLFFAIYHFDALSNGSGSAKYTLIGLGWFAIGFMIIDSARFQFSFYGLKKQVLAIILIFSSFTSVVFLLGIKIVESPAIVNRVLSLSKATYLSDLNPNHVDNILLYIIMLLIWAVANYSKNKFSVLLIAFINFMLILFLFYLSGTRGGGLGLFTATLIVGVIYFVRQNKKVYVLYVAALIGIVSSVGFLTSDRISYGFTSLLTLVTSPPSTEELFIDSSQQREEYRLSVIEIINKPRSDGDEKIQPQLSKMCWKSDTFDRGKKFTGLDRAVVFRYLLFWEGVKIWRNEPYFGHGNYNKADFLSKYEDSEPCILGYLSHIHNHYMNLLIYYGVTGLITFLFLMLYSLYMFDRMCRLRGDKLLYLPTFYFIYLLIENIFDLTFDRNSDLLSVLFCVLMLFSISLSSDSEVKDTDAK